MNDFRGSVAQQDVSITTEVTKTAVVGQNFYGSILYVTDRFSDFGGTTPTYPVVTKASYEDVLKDYQYFTEAEKKIILSNLAALFTYGTDITVHIVQSEAVSEQKYNGYFTYLDLQFVGAGSAAGGEVTEGTGETGGDGDAETHSARAAAEAGADFALSESAEKTLENIKTFDKEFTALIADLPVDFTKVKGTDTSSTAATLKAIVAKSVDVTLFARAAYTNGAAGTANAYLDASGELVGSSPALYQLGRALGKINESGTPVGNAFDMDAISFLNVLPSAEVDLTEISGASVVFANFFESVNLNYFKPVGNGTMNVTNFGGWTVLKNSIGANWVVAYLNYMNRIAAATIITTGGKMLKNPRTYEALLTALIGNCKKIIATGRIEGFEITAPSWGDLPTTDGHTITIPNAWTGSYVDNVRKVKISGNLTVAA